MSREIRKLVFCILSVFSIGVIAEDITDSTLAEFEISGSVLNQMSLTGRRTAPIEKHGKMLTPDFNLNIGINLNECRQGISANLNVDLTGTTSLTENRDLGLLKRRHVSVQVTNHTDVHYSQEMQVNSGGIVSGSPKGNTQITSAVSTSNDFRMPGVNKLVNNVATSTANKMVGQHLPTDRAQLDSQVQNGIRTASDQAQSLFKSLIDKSSAFLPEGEDKDLRASFASTAGNKGGAHIKVLGRDETQNRSAQPEFEKSTQQSTRMVLHEDLFNKTIGNELSGKKIKLSELKNILCGQKTKRLLDFCQQDLPKDAENLSIILEKDKPIEFSFDKGKIGIKLNASYEEKGFKTVPYTIEWIYSVKGGSGHLEKFSVKEKNPPKDFLSNLTDAFAPNHGDDKSSQRATAQLFSAAVKAKLEKGLKAIAKDDFIWPSVSIPTKIEADLNQSEFGKPGKRPDLTVKEAATLIPLSTKSQNGWLELTTYYCSETRPVLGVSYSDLASKKGIQLTEVFPDSPASLMGLTVGDTIESVSNPSKGTRIDSVSEATFYDWIQETAKKSDSEDRKIVIKGRDARGQSFTTETVLCPAAYPHRENAMKAMELAKELGR